jgi:hypothetical protein
VTVNPNSYTDPHGSSSVWAFWIRAHIETNEVPRTVFVIVPVHVLFYNIVFLQCEYCEHRVANRSNLRFANSLFLFLHYFSLTSNNRIDNNFLYILSYYVCYFLKCRSLWGALEFTCRGPALQKS